MPTLNEIQVVLRVNKVRLVCATCGKFSCHVDPRALQMDFFPDPGCQCPEGLRIDLTASDLELVQRNVHHAA
jgi:hypothetical protein